MCVETREVVRCEHCRLMQYRTSNSLCRKCHRPLDIEEPVTLAPQLVTSAPVPASPRQVSGCRAGEGNPPRPAFEPAAARGTNAGASDIHLQNREWKGNSDARFPGAPGPCSGSGSQRTGSRYAQPPRRGSISNFCRSLPRGSRRPAAATGVLATDALPGRRSRCCFRTPPHRVASGRNLAFGSPRVAPVWRELAAATQSLIAARPAPGIRRMVACARVDCVTPLRQQCIFRGRNFTGSG